MNDFELNERYNQERDYFESVEYNVNPYNAWIDNLDN